MKYPTAFLLVVWLLGALWGCNDADREVNSNNSFQLVSNLVTEPQSLHPLNGVSGARATILYYTAHALVSIDPATGGQMPVLAREVPELSADGLSLSVEIHPEARWDDGSSITARDVLFSYKAAAAPVLKIQSGRRLLEYIENIQLDSANPRKMIFQFRQATAINPYLANVIPILDRRFFDPEGLLERYSLAEITDPQTQLRNDSVLKSWGDFMNDGKMDRDEAYLKGTIGPYRVESWRAGQAIILAKRKNYWGAAIDWPVHAQEPDKLVFRLLKDEGRLELLVQQEELDAVSSLPTEIYNRLAAREAVRDKYELTHYPADNYAFLAFNLLPDGLQRYPIFTDRQVRLAFSHIMPVDALNEEFYSGRAQRVVSPVSQHSEEYNPNIEPIPYNPDTAASLLEAAGWIDTDGDQIRDKVIDGQRRPLRVDVTFGIGRQSTEQIVLRLADEARRVGIDLRPDPTEFRTILRDRLPQRDFDILMAGGSNSPLPHDFRQMWSSRSIPSGSNFAGYSDPRADSIMERVHLERNLDRRKQLSAAVQRMLYEAQPVIFFFAPPNHLAYKKSYLNAEAYSYRPYFLLNTWQKPPVEAAQGQ